jgi:hypothetical protein
MSCSARRVRSISVCAFFNGIVMYHLSISYIYIHAIIILHPAKNLKREM